MVFNDGFRLILDIFMTPISLNFIYFSGIKLFSYKRFKQFEDYQTVCVLLAMQLKVFLLWKKKKILEMQQAIKQNTWSASKTLWFVNFLVLVCILLYVFIILLSIRLILGRRILKIILNHDLISFVISEHPLKLIYCNILKI